MTNYICKTCGGVLTPGAAGEWTCKYCGNTYVDENVKRDTDVLRSFLDEQKIEKVNNLRRNLYDAVNAEYTDSDEIRRICSEIKALLPDDFMADFYYVANGSNQKQTAEYVNAIDTAENRDYVEGIIRFLLKSFCSEYHLPLAGLIERAYRGDDLEKLSYYNTRLSEEAEKESLGVYETAITRDVFIAYSGKNMDNVYPLVSYLEASGLTCFVAARNLRHGKGAVQNYNSAIKEALTNCRSIVFVSTPESRSFSCDALRIELPFVKQNDIANAPYEYRQNYVAMPHKYKKPRVEYRLRDSKTANAADAVVKEFFDGCEYSYTVEETASRIIRMLSEPADADVSDTAVKAKAAAREPADASDVRTPNGNTAAGKNKKPSKKNKNKKNKKKRVGILISVIAVLLCAAVGVSLYYEHMTSIEGMFVYNVSGNHIEITGINSLAKNKCTILRIPDKLEDKTVRYINKLAFGGHNKIIRVEMTDNIAEIRENAFSGCHFLYTVILSKNLINIYESAFSNCTDLTEIELPESVKYIGDGAFAGCSSLRSIRIPGQVTYICEETFSDCTDLTTVTLPAGLTEIRANAFSGCKKLSKIIFEGSADQWEAVVKGENWNGGQDIYVEFEG